MQAHHGDVNGQALLAEDAGRQRHADLQGVAEGRRDGLHAGRGDRCMLAAPLQRIDRDQEHQHRHEEGRDGQPGQVLDVQARRGAEQQGRHEDVEGHARQHPCRVLAARHIEVAQPAHAADEPAYRHGNQNRQQLVKDQPGHWGTLRAARCPAKRE